MKNDNESQDKQEAAQENRPKKVLQYGLYCKTEDQLEAFADRVDKFNREKGFVVVEMEGREVDADEVYDKPHWKVNLEFASRAYAKAFWTDPDYQTQVLV